MNKPGKLFFFTIIAFTIAAAVLAFSSCAGGAPAKVAGTAVFEDIQQKTWALAEVRISGGDTLFIDRQKLKNAGNADAYTLVIDGERVSGKANPNRYSTPYELGEDQEILLFPVVSTLMWGVIDPGMLLEQDYYTYLQGVNYWALDGETLELTTVTADDQEAALVFKLAAEDVNDAE
jgi:heat shock protein HslJ